MFAPPYLVLHVAPMTLLPGAIGTHMSFPEIRDCLLLLDDSRLTVEQLQALLKAVPSDAEREALSAYLQVLQHKGTSGGGLGMRTLN